MAVEDGHNFLQKQIEWLLAIKETNHVEYGNLSGPFMLSSMLNAKGWDGVDQDRQIEDINIRRSAVFYPYNWNQSWTADKIHEDTLAVHHWATSWRKPEKHTTHEWRLP
jgi:hypothetical protein